MKEEGRIKEIVSVFLRKPAAEIENGTDVRISSVLLHRMYAALADEGFTVTSREGIRMFGDLLQRIGLKTPVPVPDEKMEVGTGQGNAADRQIAAGFSALAGVSVDFRIGLDIEDVENLPKTDDFRQEPFYRETFSPWEISYCILQKDPIQSFAGKFAAKEAIIKSDDVYKTWPLNKIEIRNEDDGRPGFEDFKLSISHTDKAAVAVALKPAIMTMKTHA